MTFSIIPLAKVYPSVLTPQDRAVTGDTTPGASVRAALPLGSTRVRLVAPSGTRVKFGDSAVEATAEDPLLNAGDQTLNVPSGATHIAFLQSA